MKFIPIRYPHQLIRPLCSRASVRSRRADKYDSRATKKPSGMAPRLGKLHAGSTTPFWPRRTLHTCNCFSKDTRDGRRQPRVVVNMMNVMGGSGVRTLHWINVYTAALLAWQLGEHLCFQCLCSA
eukprot:6214197-Pleurochrysis_carterae.AAC.1